MQELFGNLWNLQWQQVVMWGIGGLLIWLAIKKEMEPSLLLPMGFGAILVNLPLSGAVTQVLSTGTEVGPLDVPTLVLDIKTYRTIPMAIQYFRGSYGKVEMAPMMACIMITILPVIILYLICQKYIIDGVVAGAVKG